MPATSAFERARLARDVRFDGRFFTGVLTTKIYCRPVCPANPPKAENVRYFPTAAAASEAGFRPCLRCRPECAPGTPAWHGSSTTVRRGLKLIANGALDDGNVEQLADRLGVTGRHLRRLFRKHLGASPLAVAHTQRLHFAKRLIDETRLPMQQVAVAAGYGSTRRFNDAFRNTYGRTPRQLRRHSDDNSVNERAAHFSIELSYRRPYDWSQMLGFLGSRGIPGVESAVDGVYRRTIVVDGVPGIIEVADNPEKGCLRLRVDGVPTSELFSIVQRVREMFDLDAPVADIRRSLGRDPFLKTLVRGRNLPRVPGTWDPFELMIRAVLGQQVSVAAATTLAGRVAARYGTPLPERLRQRYADVGLTTVFPTPPTLRRARFNDMGIVGARAETMRRVAGAVADGDVVFDAAGDYPAFLESLVAIKGIGDWTTQYVGMRALKNPDAFPGSDLGLLRALDSENGGRLKPAELEARAEAWRPWRAYAALLLWNSDPGSGG